MYRIPLLCLLFVTVLNQSIFAQPQENTQNSFSTIIDEIKKLESVKDPKCHATASRLEDFMYGTPLSSEARFEKVALQKELILKVWREASLMALERGQKKISWQQLHPIIQKILSHVENSNGDWEVSLPNAQKITINKHDKRQYSSVAYALRALLSVEQDILLRSEINLLPLDTESIILMKQLVDVYTLAALQTADMEARLKSQFEISKPLFIKSWKVFESPERSETATANPALSPSKSQQKAKPSDFSVLKAIINQKVASYLAYNDLSMPVFLRNLQVYFARQRWPKDPEEGNSLKNHFAESMIAFISDLMIGAEKIAQQRGHILIRVEDVNDYLHAFLPHEINEWEDAIFFPNLPIEERITIESYDMDAFRDSGIHWRYLQYAIEDPQFKGTLEPDPFAAELLTESTAILGVLTLRMAGDIAKEENRERLNTSHIDKALKRIQDLINSHARTSPHPVEADPLYSSVESETFEDYSKFFSDITEKIGITFMHRSSDWLSRLIRSYVMKGENVAQLMIPPAFGGSGVAAEDINQDGFIDILLLSGTGNRLFVNNGKGSFKDITAESGILWKRPEDGFPGEPRQPIIADFDNDGLQDILITYVNDNHRLYRNLGNNKFEDVTEKAGLGGKGSVGGPATASDIDQDGLLDIYIGYFGDYLHGILPTFARNNTNGLPNKLFRNMGNMRFEDITAGSGVDNPGWTQAVGHTDLDLDGLQDIIVGNDFGINAYYKNLGNGKFKDIAPTFGLNKPSYTMNIGISDINRDLYPDIYISNIVIMDKDEKYVMPGKDTPLKFNPENLAHMRVVEANDLFTSRVENGKFEGYILSKAVKRGLSSTGWAWDADFFDFDNDGDDDLYCLNGMNDYRVYSSDNPYYTDPQGETRNVYYAASKRETNVFFINRNGKLENVSDQSGADLLSNSRSASFLDYDEDGDLDIILNNFHGPAVFYRNNTEKLNNNWIKIRLQCDPQKRCNRDAIGGRIIVSTEHHKGLWREVHSTTGYLSVHPKQQNIGIGKDTKADVEVHWPNGEVTHYNNIEANHAYLVVQGKGIFKQTFQSRSKD